MTFFGREKRNNSGRLYWFKESALEYLKNQVFRAF
jgi:hypothetical protein